MCPLITFLDYLFSSVGPFVFSCGGRRLMCLIPPADSLRQRFSLLFIFRSISRGEQKSFEVLCSYQFWGDERYLLLELGECGRCSDQMNPCRSPSPGTCMCGNVVNLIWHSVGVIEEEPVAFYLHPEVNFILSLIFLGLESFEKGQNSETALFSNVCVSFVSFNSSDTRPKRPWGTKTAAQTQ